MSHSLTDEQLQSMEADLAALDDPKQELKALENTRTRAKAKIFELCDEHGLKPLLDFRGNIHFCTRTGSPIMETDRFIQNDGARPASFRLVKVK